MKLNCSICLFYTNNTEPVLPEFGQSEVHTDFTPPVHPGTNPAGGGVITTNRTGCYRIRITISLGLFKIIIDLDDL